MVYLLADVPFVSIEYLGSFVGVAIILEELDVHKYAQGEWVFILVLLGELELEVLPVHTHHFLR